MAEVRLPKRIMNSGGWCQGCGHGVVVRLIAEVLDELGVADKAIAVESVKDGEVLHSTEAILSQNPSIRFDHYRPSMYLIKHPDIWKIEDISDALDRFERVTQSVLRNSFTQLSEATI